MSVPNFGISDVVSADAIVASRQLTVPIINISSQTDQVKIKGSMAYLPAIKQPLVSDGQRWHQVLTADGQAELSNKTILGVFGSQDVGATKLAYKQAPSGNTQYLDLGSVLQTPAPGQVLTVGQDGMSAIWENSGGGGGGVATALATSTQGVSVLVNGSTPVQGQILIADGQNSATWQDIPIPPVAPATQLATSDAQNPVTINTNTPMGANQVLVSTSSTDATWQTIPAPSFLAASASPPINIGGSAAPSREFQTLTSTTNPLVATWQDTAARSLVTATNTVAISASTQPSGGQVLVAENASSASWQDIPPTRELATFTNPVSIVSVSPTSGQVLVASSGVAASWQAAPPARTLATNSPVTTVNIASSAPPTAGQALIAVSSTSAAWQDIPASLTEFSAVEQPSAVGQSLSVTSLSPLTTAWALPIPYRYVTSSSGSIDSTQTLLVSFPAPGAGVNTMLAYITVSAPGSRAAVKYIGASIAKFGSNDPLCFNGALNPTTPGLPFVIYEASPASESGMVLNFKYDVSYDSLTQSMVLSVIGQDEDTYQVSVQLMVV